MSHWFRRSKSGKAVSFPADSAPALPPVPSGLSEDAASTIIHARKMNDWLDEAFSECARNGGFDQLDGKGKPLDVPTGDALNSILKNANVLPSWLELQHEIRDELRAFLRKHESDTASQSARSELDAINHKIIRYNTLVPTPMLQKGKIHPDSARRQLVSWE